MDIHAYDSNGQALVGQQGELVCTKPFHQCRSIFGMMKMGKNIKKHISKSIPNLASRDYVSISEHGGVTMHGRSDATLNPVAFGLALRKYIEL